MTRAHLFVDGVLARYLSLQHCPREGETLRLKADLCVKVTEVIWCIDEDPSGGQRVNLRTEKLS